MSKMSELAAEIGYWNEQGYHPDTIARMFPETDREWILTQIESLESEYFSTHSKTEDYSPHNTVNS